jgi:hypothetical protein
VEPPNPPPVAEASEPPRRPARTALALLISLALIGGLFAAGYVARDRAAPPEGTGLEDIFRQTQSLRELTLLDPLQPEYLSSEELAAAVRAESEANPVTGLPDAMLLRALEILDDSTDLQEALVDSAAAAVIGFYDPETGRLVIESRAGAELTPLSKVTLVHELTHGITDQHFDLDSVVTGDEPADEFAARLALVEGDATLAMTRWQTEHLSFGEIFSMGLEGGVGAFEGAPTAPGLSPVISEIQAMPYLDGMLFVEALYERGGWDAVNEAYANPPVTTEQVMHPERYLAGELGEDVRAPGPPSGATRVVSGDVGELFLRAWLSGGGGALIPGFGSGREAAEGWDGAAFTTWVDTQGLNVAMDTRWDTAEDAVEFEAAVLDWFGDHFGPVEVRGDRRVSGAHCLDVVRTGTTVTFELNESGCRR